MTFALLFLQVNTKWLESGTIPTWYVDKEEMPHFAVFLYGYISSSIFIFGQ